MTFFKSLASWITAILGLLLVISPAYAQSSNSSAEGNSAKKNSRSNREVSVTETFEPAFRIEPLLIKHKGKPNDVVDFKFTIESSNRGTSIEVIPIGLRQEITGQILHDEQAQQTEYVKLVTPKVMQIEPNSPATIEGVVRVPNSDAKFHSFGILVRDLGNAATNSNSVNNQQGQTTSAAINFVTQYVLRVDVELEGIRGESTSQLRISRAEMVPFEGRPMLQIQLDNPSETTFEYQARARLRNSPSDRSFKHLRTVMPVRMTMETEDRYIGRLLGKSSVRMQELLPEAIAGGTYELDVEVLVEDRVIKRATLPVEVDAADYPAQEVLIAQVGQSTQISPAQIELSFQRGGSRRATVLVKNLSRETNIISLQALDQQQLELTGVTVQPESITLPPLGSRKVTLTLRGQSDEAAFATYGSLLVKSESDSREFSESRAIPLAVLYKKSQPAVATIAPLQWDSTGKYPGFKTSIRNTSETHLPVQARLSITDENGRRTIVPAGFGKWLMPGETAKLDFRIDRPLPPGNYQLRCDVAQDEKPISIQQSFTVGDFQVPPGLSAK